MSVMEAFWSAPPVSRTITAAAVLLSVPTHMGMINPYYIAFLPYKLFTFPPEIWRLVTSLLLTGPQLGLIMDPYFLYQYGSQLEIETMPPPGDFFVYVVTVSVVVLLTGGFYLNGVFLLPAFTLALARTYSLQNPNRMMTFFIVTFSAKWLPFAMLAMTAVINGPNTALIQATGLLAAHTHDFLTKIWPEYGGGKRYLDTPAFVRRWFMPPPGTTQRRSYGTATPAPSQDANRNPSRGFTSGSSWDGRGAGRRLG